MPLHSSRLAIVLLSLCFALLLSSQSFAHVELLKACGDLKSDKKLGEEILKNGLIAEAYDLSGDGKVDLVTYSVPKHGQHDSFPLFYEFDSDGDGNPDVLYIDKLGTGSCEGFDLYDDYNKSQENGHKSPQDMPRFLMEN